jgi:hypothetical protein
LSLDAVVIDETPLIRYRLRVVGKILKIIKDPSRPAFRTEHGKSVWEMKRDFTISHQIVGWREELSGGIVRLFTFDFEDPFECSGYFACAFFRRGSRASCDEMQ